MYVCGVTPYDATHLGHAATYVTFDLVVRAMLDVGHEVDYVQNVTDVDDPLLERAARDGRDWRELATSEVDLFREDMTALGVLPPDQFLGVVESMDEIIAAVRRLVDGDAAYRVPVPEAEGAGEDIYLDLARATGFGEVSHWSREQMEAVFPRRGGDPERPGKRDPLDPLLWRAAREGEPSWDDDLLGPGRPGWHIECTAISLAHLGIPFDIKGGGSDLVFPHHEMSAVQATALTGGDVFARHYVHQAMVGYQGEKMSKSKGNLVLVSRLRARGVDPMAIRLLLLAQHYRTEWEFTESLLDEAQARLERWRSALSVNRGADATDTVAAVRAAIADDLDSPAALSAVDAWAEKTLAGAEDDQTAPGLLARSVDAILGVRL
jgi:L-cysteine:1D-myo-inositol 2-amino-2-deoxy-alpha-D-glucopyranoside ligase